MSKEKQIKEIAKDLCRLTELHCDCGNGRPCFRVLKKAEALYDAGYRKQRENAIELPCKIGDRIYRLNRLCTAVTEATVKAIYYTEDKKDYPKSHLVIQYDLARGRVRVNFSEFGKTVFLTREEAEARIKGE